MATRTWTGTCTICGENFTVPARALTLHNSISYADCPTCDTSCEVKADSTPPPFFAPSLICNEQTDLTLMAEFC